MKSEDRMEYELNIKRTYIFRFLHHLHFFSGVLIPFFTIWGGISFFQVMILQAFFTLSVFILEIPTGVIADKYGRRTSLILAGIVTSMAAIVYSSYPSFWVFMAGEVLWAIGSSLISGADQAMIYDSLRELGREKESKKIYGRWNSIGLASIGIAAPIGSLIAEYMGLRYTMMFMSIPLLLAGLYAFSFKEPEVGRIQKKEKYLDTLKEGVKYFKNHKILKILAFDFVLIGSISFFIIWVYQVVLQNLGISIKWFGFVAAGIVFVQIVVLNSFGFFERVFRGKKNYLFFTAIITGLGFIAIGLSKNVYLSIVMILLVGAFGLTRKPLLQNYMNKFIESHNRATVLSTVSMLYMFTAAVLNLVWGYLVDWNLKYTLVLIGSLIIVITIVSRIEEEHLVD
jgi:MFS family permease